MIRYVTIRSSWLRENQETMCANVTEMDFDSVMKDQGIKPDALPDREQVLEVYEHARLRGDALQATTLKPGTTGGYCYAVAIEDRADLRVTLWVRRAPKICVVMYPRDQEWDPHATYHVDGRYHSKSYGTKFMVQKRQPLDRFKGTEHLGYFGGHGGALPKCNPADFVGVLRLPPGILTGLEGGVMVDLVEPGAAPNQLHREPYNVVREETYKDCSPWVVVAAVLPRAAKGATAEG